MMHQLIHWAIEIEQILGLPAALVAGWIARGRASLRSTREDARVHDQRQYQLPDGHSIGAVNLLETLKEQSVPVPTRMYAAAAGISLSDLMHRTH